MRKVAGWVGERAMACLFVAVLVVVTAVLGGLALAVPMAPKCLPGEYRAAAMSEANPATEAATSSNALEVDDVKQTQIILGRAIAPARTEIALKTDMLPPNVEVTSPLHVRVQSFRKGDGGDVSQAVLAWGNFTSRHTAEIFLCIERQGGGDENRYGFVLEPGQFTGSVTVLDPRLPTTTIPFTVELAYPNPYAPLVPFGLLVLGGSLYLMVLHRDPNSRDAKVGLLDFDGFLRRPSGLAAVVAGTVAALGVYVTAYLSSTSWGSSGADYFLLVSAMFTAFISAGTAFRFASNLEASGPPRDPEPAARLPGRSGG